MVKDDLAAQRGLHGILTVRIGNRLSTFAVKRRANGEGTAVSRRPDGRWMARLRYTDPLTGLAHREHVYGRTQGECVDRLLALKNRLRTGLPGRDARLTLGAWLDRWLADVAAPSLRPNVLALYRGVIDRNLKPVLGSRPLAALKPATIQHALVGAGAKGSPRMRQVALQILKTSLKQAVKWQLIAANPAADVQRPQTPERRVAAMTPDQVRAFLAAAEGDPFLPLYVLATFAGPRQGEILALRWCDLDVGRGVARITGTADRKKRGTITAPKTRRSARTIALSPRVLDALPPRGPRAAFVFGAARPLSASTLLKRFKAILRRAQLPETFRFHDLRHTYATLALGAGVPLKVVSEQLGHSSIQITADTYMHLVPAMHADAALAIDRYFAEDGSQKGSQEPSDGQVIALPSAERTRKKP